MRATAIFTGIAAALPDAATATVFLSAWLYPGQWPGLVGALMAVMLYEFLAIHASGMLGGITDTAKRRRKNLKAAITLTAVYLLMMAGISAAFKTWWPMVWFVWLVGSKLVAIAVKQSGAASRQNGGTRQMIAMAAMLYLGGVAVTLILPVPRLGLTAEVVDGLALDQHGSGVWIDEPHRLIAFGFLYFAGSALGHAYRVMRRPIHSVEST